MLSFFRMLFSDYAVHEVAGTDRYIVSLWSSGSVPLIPIRHSILERLEGIEKDIETRSKGIWNIMETIEVALDESELYTSEDIRKMHIHDDSRIARYCAVSFDDVPKIIQAHKKLSEMNSEERRRGHLSLVCRA